MGLTPASASSPPRRRWVSVASWLLFVAAFAGWFMYLRPPALGGSTGYVIVSGASMEPLLHTGDMAVVHPRSEYGIGDVVAYRIPQGDVGAGMLVIHRIIGGGERDGFVMQGDNRDYADLWKPTSDEVVGVLRWHVPHLGTLLFLLRSPIVLAAVLGFMAFWVIGMREPELDAATLQRRKQRMRRKLERTPIALHEHPLIVRRRSLQVAAGPGPIPTGV